MSFTICNGETFGIVGNSGCGKSTIANMLLSLIKPDSGTIEIDGTIQIIFQHPETSLDPAKKIGYSLEEPMIIHKMYDKAGRKKRVKELLDLVDLGEELLDRYPHQISGGEAQRIMIARALSLDPKILILDEPTAGLDPAGRDEILDLVARMHRERGITVILVSHSMEDVAKYVDRIIVMNHGQVAFDGAPREVFHHYKELEQIGLAAPQVTYLMHELKERGLEVNTDATTVAEARESLLEVLLGRIPHEMEMQENAMRAKLVK